MKREGLLVILSAPSGGGKTSICQQILRRHSDYAYSISVTTRPRRGEEIDGRDYHFVSVKVFQRMIDEGGLVEWAQVHGNYYGTRRETVEENLSQGSVTLFDLDVQGGMRIKASYPQAVSIFILPPSTEELERRLRDRRTDDEAIIQRRLENAKKEMEWWPRYDYLVVNDRLEDSVQMVEAIIVAEGCKSTRLMNQQQELELPMEMVASPEDR